MLHLQPITIYEVMTSIGSKTRELGQLDLNFLDTSSQRLYVRPYQVNAGDSHRRVFHVSGDVSLQLAVRAAGTMRDA